MEDGVLTSFESCSRDYGYSQGRYKPKGGIRKQTRKWTMKDGTKIRLCDMDDGHLANAIAMLERTGRYLYSEAIMSGFRMLCILQGEMAIDSVERGLEDLQEHRSWEDFVPDIYYRLTLDHERRKGMEKTFHIAGVQHHPGMKAVIKDLEIGSVLDLIPDPENQYDPNAVRIMYEGNMLGFVPKKFSSDVASIFEIADLECVIVELNPSAKPWEQCKVTVGQKEE